MELRGFSLIGFEDSSNKGPSFAAVNPDTGGSIAPEFHSAAANDVDRAACLADNAFRSYGRWTGKQRAALLRAIAEEVEELGGDLVTRTALETALPQQRLRGELARTCNQLRLFASLAEEGSWVNARIDCPDAARKPAPKPDLRSMLRPIGPVSVFGASNFPLAFSVAGGDTASALAAGNPVIVKAHPAHPGASEMVGRAISAAARKSGAPDGIFSLLFDSGIAVGRALVQHPAIKAAGFTGSRLAGRALMDLAASRPDPIPFFAEMSSTNPVFILPRAAAERGEQIASGLHNSVLLGAGQFCTKPGLVLLSRSPESERIGVKLEQLISAPSRNVLLTQGISKSYQSGLQQRGAFLRKAAANTDSKGFCAGAALFEIEIDSLAETPELTDELFGPSALLVRYNSREQMLRFAESLEGHLTATIHGTDDDLREAADLIAILEHKAGRLVFNGYPTGVEVSHAMVHGGPYPATSDVRFTSVGTQAILRFARPVCFQNCPDEALPAELQAGNPLGIWRTIDGQLSRDPLSATT
ncbi:MAG TPA: aldehyde dehydrogenase (NADP(+)) [Terriglobales bacterium]|nr:aldehyde dehydrogenase (NADP(+)) [Terriglobales bacterium]